MQTAAQLKQAQRKRKRESGLVPFTVSEVWTTPEKHLELKMRVNALIAEIISR